MSECRTPNDDLLSQVGQDKTHKDGACAYDAKCGVYNPAKKPIGSLEQSKSQASPFGALRDR
jgi:hypothetical protein